MSDTKKFPMLGILFSFSAGCAVLAGALTGFGWMMVKRGMTQDAAGPLATVAVCLGSFLSGLILASLRKEKGLLWGAAEGMLFAGMLVLLGTLYQNKWETAHLVRAGLTFLMGVSGGILGALRTERRRR